MHTRAAEYGHFQEDLGQTTGMTSVVRKNSQMQWKCAITQFDLLNL